MKAYKTSLNSINKGTTQMKQKEDKLVQRNPKKNIKHSYFQTLYLHIFRFKVKEILSFESFSSLEIDSILIMTFAQLSSIIKVMFTFGLVAQAT
jgi:hypothetical protein